MESDTLPVALVTGAARGIGKGIAASLLRAGWSVVLTDVDESAGQAAAEELARLGTVEFIAMDVSDEASVIACIERIEGDFGQLDGLVNNAGIADPDNGPIEQLSLEAWNRKLGTNLTGAFWWPSIVFPCFVKPAAPSSTLPPRERCSQKRTPKPTQPARVAWSR